MSGSNSSITPCFTSGTRVATDKGDMAVEAIRPGMRVLTRDNGPQDVIWTGGRTASFRDICENRDLRPVLIRADALGPGMPAHDIEVSPDHRVLVSAARLPGRFLTAEILVAARHLVDGEGITWALKQDTRYVHILFPQHQVLLSDGLWSESFRPEAQVLTAMAPAIRRQVEDALPDTTAREIANQPARRLIG